MKTTFLPLLAFLMVSLLFPQTHHASSPPLLAREGEALETAPAETLASAELQPGPAKIAGRNVNVRAKATINSEVVTQLQNGDEVLVEEVILRPDAVGNDPTRWARIAYPAAAPAWVHSTYIDAATSTVKPKRLNVRSGPGENFTVIGTIQSGDTVAPTGSKGDWVKIQAPQGATAYVAAKLLRQEAALITEVATTETQVVETETVETAVVESQPEIATGTETTELEMGTETEVSETETVEGATTVTDTNELATGLEPLPEIVPLTETLPEIAPEMIAAPEEPLPPRVVAREGIVRTFTSIQAPSDYKLVSPDNGRTINYLYTTSTNLDLGRYVGLHIIATGEESLDRRWPNMPVLTLKRIVLVE